VSPDIPRKRGVWRGLASYLAFLAVGALVWTHRMTESPYRPLPRVAICFGAIAAAYLATRCLGARQWRRPILLGGLAAVFTPLAVLFVGLLTSGYD
jgi:peptidoglycan/LPS O-acetylase OafA/YrhL